MEYMIDPNIYVYQDMVLLVLSTIGLTIILVRAEVLKTIRAGVTRKYKAKQKLYNIWWLLENLLNCELCCSVWVAVVCYALIYFGVYFVIYILCVPTFVYLYFEIIDRIGRKV